MKIVRKIISQFRRKPQSAHLHPDFAAAFIRGMEQADKEHLNYTVSGPCRSILCREIEPHRHGHHCHFTCVCGRGSNCYDDRT